MERSRRTKRASAEDLYRTCKAAGTCPPDVVNKIEGTTVADSILKYGGSAVFFGGLGIGTGRGSGGATGYTPLGGATGGVRVGAGSAVRPSVAVDALGPQDVAPLLPRMPEAVEDFLPEPGTVAPESRPVGPEDPSVIELVDLGSSGDVSVVGEVAPQPGAGVPATGDDAPTLSLPGPPEPDPGPGPSFGVHGEPGLHTAPGSSARWGETSATHHVFVRQALGQNVGDVPTTQDIELDTWSTTIEEGGFYTSTPEGRVSRPPAYTSRRYVQVEVRNPLFLGRAQDLVTFTNPAYEGLSFEFPYLEEPAAAPDEAFADLVQLHRPVYTRGSGARVRLSRLGRRGTMLTRSGAMVGAEVHFYQDISSIAPAESIEMDVLGERAGDMTVVTGGMEEGFEDVLLDEVSSVSEDALLDHYEDLTLGPLVLQGSRGSAVLQVDDLFTQYPRVVSGIDVDYGSGYDIPDGGPVDPEGVYPGRLQPAVTGIGNAGAGYWEPSLFHKRKRRRRGQHL